MTYRVFFLVLLLPAFAFSYTVVRNDGKSFSGELIKQTPQETIIKDPAGTTIKFRVNQIDWNQTTAQIQQEEKSRANRNPVQSQNFETRQITKLESDRWTGEPFSFDFKDIDIKDLFRFIADISGLNVILDPSIRGSVTLKLTDVPWDQVLDLITRNQGLGYMVEGNVIRIAPYSKISQEVKARMDAERQQLLNAPLVTKILPLSYAKAADIERIVKKLLTPKGSVIADTRTNILIITDIESNIDTITGVIGR